MSVRGSDLQRNSCGCMMEVKPGESHGPIVKAVCDKHREVEA